MAHYSSVHVVWLAWANSKEVRRNVVIWGMTLAILARVSELILRFSLLCFMRARSFTAMFRAFAALGVVPTLNCLTDSVFQFGLNVPIYMVVLLTAPHASAA
jgi:hypothetical protein